MSKLPDVTDCSPSVLIDLFKVSPSIGLISRFASASSGAITAWIKLDGTGWMTIFSARQASSNDYFISLGVAGGGETLFASDKNNDSVSDIRAITGLSDGGWHHVALVSNGSAYLFM